MMIVRSDPELGKDIAANGRRPAFTNQAAVNGLSFFTKRDVPKNVKVQIRLDTTFKIFCEIVRLVNADRRGRRYGHPVLDIVKEINRYVSPKLT